MNKRFRLSPRITNRIRLLLSLEKFKLYTFRIDEGRQINGIFKLQITETSSRFKIFLPEECET